MRSSGETEAAVGPGQPLCPPQGHCNLREVQGERAGEEEAGRGTFSGTRVMATPGLPSLPISPQDSLLMEGDTFPLTPPEGPGGLAVVTRPQALKKKGKRDSEGMTGGRSEAAQSGLAAGKEEEPEQDRGAGPRSGTGAEKWGDGQAEGQRGGSASCPPILPPSLSFMILKQPSSLGWRPQETSHLGNKTVSWRP